MIDNTIDALLGPFYCFQGLEIIAIVPVRQCTWPIMSVWICDGKWVINEQPATEFMASGMISVWICDGSA